MTIITVAYDSEFQDTIASGWFHAPFELGDNDTIYIRIEDGSNYGNTTGSYAIGVYGEDNLPFIGSGIVDTYETNPFIVPTIFGVLLVILVLVRMYKKK